MEEALTNVPAKPAEETPWYFFGKRKAIGRGDISNNIGIADNYENFDVSFLPFDSYLIVFVLGEYNDDDAINSDDYGCPR